MNILDIIFGNNKYKEHETYHVDDRIGREDDDYSLIKCKNCEEYFEEVALGNLVNHKHGNYKEISDNYKQWVQDKNDRK